MIAHNFTLTLVFESQPYFFVNYFWKHFQATIIYFQTVGRLLCVFRQTTRPFGLENVWLLWNKWLNTARSLGSLKKVTHPKHLGKKGILSYHKENGIVWLSSEMNVWIYFLLMTFLKSIKHKPNLKPSSKNWNFAGSYMRLIHSFMNFRLEWHTWNVRLCSHDW